MPIDHKTKRYSITELLSYGARYNFCGSGRGIGKTFDFILKAMNKKGIIVSLTRHKVGIASSVNGMKQTLLKGGFDMHRIEFGKEEMIPGESDAGDMRVLKLDGQTKIMFLALAQLETIKLMCFPDNVNWVFMDEFVPVSWKKIGGLNISEGKAIQMIMKTIDHDTFHPREERGLQPLRFVGFFNPITWNNPILQDFKLIPKGYGITKIHKDIVLEMVETPDYALTDVEKFLGDDMGTSNQWLEASALVEQKPKGAKPLLSLKMDSEFTFYQFENRIFIVKGTVPTKFRLTSSDFPEDGEQTLTPAMKAQIDKWNRKGLVRFNDMNIKYQFIREYTTI